ncbi:MAG: SDR family oxidoreductase [Dehalococcoidales bacterium]|nr:SDR family oxidoreductase [Dehalococcoidales bacterium]
MSKGNVLVTGGAGFLGSWLCDFLVREGFRVTCVDNLSSGDRKNLEHLDVEFIKHDARKPFNLGIKVDYIFHLASRASPADFQKYPVDILLTNSLGTYNVLKFAEQNNARFVLTSTSEVYGNPLQYPQNEDYWGNVNPIGPRSCYDESKRFSEALAMAFYRESGLDIRVGRIFNTYGERMRKDDGRVTPNLINQALRNEPITVYGDGSQTRSFCYVSDMVDGLTRLMFLESLRGEVINLGSPNEISILELAELIKGLVNTNSEIIFKPLPPDDPTRRKPDIAKAKQKLDWEPVISLEEGLARTIGFFRASQ